MRALLNRIATRRGFAMNGSMMRGFVHGLVICLVIAWIGAHSGAQPIPVGAEFQVNTLTSGFQFVSPCAMDDQGDFVVTWPGTAADGTTLGHFGQRFNRMATRLGGEFQVSTYTTHSSYPGFGAYTFPVVATDADGDFVVAWHNYTSGSGFDIFGRRYDSSGAPQGAQFRVNTYTPNAQRSPVVAMDQDGDFVVAWWSRQGAATETDVIGQRFDASGARIGVEFVVNSYTTSVQANPNIAADEDGGFVVVWDSVGQDGSNGGLFGRRFDSAGAPLTPELQVSSYTIGYQGFPGRVEARPGGGFVVTWTDSAARDGSAHGVFTRIFEADGAPLGPDFQVNTYTGGYQRAPSVAQEGNGDFLITWYSCPLPCTTNSETFGRLFTSSGLPRTADFQLNSHTPSFQTVPCPGMHADGDFIVAWSSYGQDGSHYGIFGRRFVPPDDGDSDGVSDDLEDGGPNGGDGNDDAIADSDQANVTSLPTPLGGPYLTVVSPPGTTLVDVVSFEPRFLPSPPEGVTFPAGGLSFMVTGVTTGGAIEVDVLLPAGTPLSSYYKYGGEPGMAADHWYEFLDDGTTGAVLGIDTVTLKLVDGARGDGDLAANGVIVEPGGPALVGNLDIDGDGEALALTDGLLVLRSVFGFTGPTLVTGAVGASCTRCTGPAVQAHIADLGGALDIDGDGASDRTHRRAARAAVPVRVHRHHVDERRGFGQLLAVRCGGRSVIRARTSVKKSRGEAEDGRAWEAVNLRCKQKDLRTEPPTLWTRHGLTDRLSRLSCGILIIGSVPRLHTSNRGQGGGASHTVC